MPGDGITEAVLSMSDMQSAASATGYKPSHRFFSGKIHRAVAAVCLAAALFFSPGAAAAMTTEGLPPWLESHVLRGLTAVWQEIPAGPDRFETLALVARRLFAGYHVTVLPGAVGRGGDPRVIFTAQTTIPWSVALVLPELRAPVTSWFARDSAGMGGEIEHLLDGLPTEALSWADSALHDQVDAIVRHRLPGWDFSLLVRLEEGHGVLQISFRPRQPLVLAVTPSIFSSTLPVMFQSDLSAKLISGLSPIIGLPVGWIDLHRQDVELLARNFLEDRNAVSNTRSRVEVEFVPDQVSRVDATVNSERLIFQIWLAAYAGIEGRYPEAGLLLGWNTRRYTGIDLELYSETIMDLGDFGLTSRLGGRVPLWKNFRVGLEVEWPEQEIWYRVWWDSNRVRRLYAWWCYSSEYGNNAALGYRLNEHISIEIHYDNRYEDKIGLRGILQL